MWEVTLLTRSPSTGFLYIHAVSLLHYVKWALQYYVKSWHCKVYAVVQNLTKDLFFRRLSYSSTYVSLAQAAFEITVKSFYIINTRYWGMMWSISCLNGHSLETSSSFLFQATSFSVGCLTECYRTRSMVIQKISTKINKDHYYIVVKFVS